LKMQVTDLLDHLRCESNTSRLTIKPSRFSAGPSEGFCNGTTADSNPTMCMFGYPGNSDDRMEGCSSYGCFYIGHRRREPCLHFRFPQSSSRRSHRRTQDQFDCMWAERHHPASTYNDVGLKREYHIRV
jgi:hypothetical protein